MKFRRNQSSDARRNDARAQGGTRTEQRLKQSEYKVERRNSKDTSKNRQQAKRITRAGSRHRMESGNEGRIATDETGTEQTLDSERTACTLVLLQYTRT